MSMQQWFKERRRAMTVAAIVAAAVALVALAVLRTSVDAPGQTGGGKVPDAVASLPSEDAHDESGSTPQAGAAADGDRRQQALEDLDRIRSLRGAGLVPGELDLAGRAVSTFLTFSSKETADDRASRVSTALEDTPADEPSIAQTILGRRDVQVLDLEGKVTDASVCDVSDYRQDGVVDAEVCVTVAWQAHISMKDGTGLSDHTESGVGTWIATVPYERSVDRALTIREPSSADMTWSVDR
ncbi:hypothetical protein F8O07_06805 [Pseudoclavibacter sp. CFCC 13796]|uniref:hypothetical protein n=1 Tax=Pseudoclavibacter sp. CFCC 13796 TaxID=2615179 RepID=UPI0013016CAD|nr:hypothetical protein [Pseudoclavibacter sp. CFCC 13796]KAB1661608.1 hypothetical protein F8O07_06805 [Pseudoclavibacter sp. CFCC 13796]